MKGGENVTESHHSTVWLRWYYIKDAHSPKTPANASPQIIRHIFSIIKHIPPTGGFVVG